MKAPGSPGTNDKELGKQLDWVHFELRWFVRAWKRLRVELRDAAERAKVNWELVVATDARPSNGDWNKLLMLLGRAMPAVEQALLAADKTMLVTYAGLLARYDQMGLLSRLSQRVGRRDGIPGLWLLLAGDAQAMLDGKPVPLVSPGQRAQVPKSWLTNVHRS